MTDRIKAYKDLYEEAEARIPLYTKEWTNYNRSDPGITILQNFAAYAWLQRESIETAAETARRELLALTGFREKQTACSRVFLKAGFSGEYRLPSHKKLACGDLCFETERPVTLWDIKILDIYRKDSEGLHKTEYLPDGAVALPAAVFGEKPCPGAALYLTLSGLPPAGERFFLYAQVEEAEGRNPFEETHIPPFAKVRWQCLTGEGFTPMEAADGTAAFLKSGEVALTVPDNPRLWKTEKEAAYVIRCVLEEEQYDQVPRLLSLFTGLFPAVQRNTAAVVLKAPGGERAVFESEMVDFGYFFLLVREEPEGPYYRYEPSEGKDQGRYYRILVQKPGLFSIQFEPEVFGFGPAEGPESLLLVCYTEEMAGKRRLGSLYGCVDQEIELPSFPGIHKEGFVLLAEGRDKAGTPIYIAAPPEDEGPGSFYYRLLPRENKIQISDAGPAQGWSLYLAGACVTRGEGGNIKKETRFRFLNPGTEREKELLFLNPGPGLGGVSMESEEEETRRFAREIRQTRTAVREEDFEQLVRHTPGLRISKVGTGYDSSSNRVKVIVMPDSEQSFPELPGLYRSEILAWLSKHRLLCTRIELDSPIYVPIHVRSTICVRASFEGCRQQIDEVLRRELDYKKKDREFGEILRFHSIVKKLEELECVAFVKDFMMKPASVPGVSEEEAAIRLAGFCLPYPGEISIHLVY